MTWWLVLYQHSRCNALQPGRVQDSEKMIKYENIWEKWANVQQVITAEFTCTAFPDMDRPRFQERTAGSQHGMPQKRKSGGRD